MSEKGFPNYAGRDDVALDDLIIAELTEAGITTFTLPEGMRKGQGEVKTIILGEFHGWAFERAWYYWIAKGPGIPLEPAMDLHAAHGQVVRVEGHCGCPTPLELCKGMPVTSYHVDTPRGLKALQEVITKLLEAGKLYFPPFVTLDRDGFALKHVGHGQYLRHAGQWTVMAERTDDYEFFVIVGGTPNCDHLIGTELHICTEEVWKESNVGYVPKKYDDVPY